MSFKTDILSISPLSEQMTKGFDAWNVNFETLYSGQFMLSTQLMILNQESGELHPISEFCQPNQDKIFLS